jgi:hypothetical protein
LWQRLSQRYAAWAERRTQQAMRRIADGL